MRMSAMAMALAVVSCGAGAAGPAWGQGLAVGVKGGVNLARTAIDVEGGGPSLDPRIGLVAGAFVTLPIASWLELQPEVLYAMKGAKVNDTFGASTLQIDYVELPVLARISRPGSGRIGYYAAGGPTFGLRVRARSRTEFEGETGDIDVSDQVSRTDVGVALGGGVEIGALVIDARYTLGLTDIDKDDSDEVKVSNRVLSLTVGFRF